MRGVPCHEVAPSKRSFQSLSSLISAHEVPTMIVIVQRSASLAHCTCGCDVSLLTAPRSHSFGGLRPASTLLMCTETSPDLDAEMPAHPREIPVEDLAKMAAEFAQQLTLVHAALRGDTDIVLVRLPITQVWMRPLVCLSPPISTFTGAACCGYCTTCRRIC